MSERLPRTVTDKVKYQLVLRAFEGEWTACYEFGEGQRFGGLTGHGSTIDQAIEDLRALFEFDLAFKHLRHLLPE